ncbi:hypothetical protein SEA_ESTES_119 [Mycobacterium phage Estes]|uniref:Uncharacterized protein n=1 Tax=Mycobacterium phage Estes TaxID=2759459 RepID=A0A7G9A2H7_9CAUD|nr:hypothetical protein J4U03_gp147 [Mycobacterium phage Estes]QNL30816.1 hypothetical protein SEA_ESTES_119 [Mycobacterium phage Estes]
MGAQLSAAEAARMRAAIDWVENHRVSKERHAQLVEALTHEMKVNDATTDLRVWFNRAIQINDALNETHGRIPDLGDWPGDMDL